MAIAIDDQRVALSLNICNPPKIKAEITNAAHRFHRLFIMRKRIPLKKISSDTATRKNKVKENSCFSQSNCMLFIW